MKKWIGIAVVVALVFWGISVYNGLVTKNEAVEQRLSQVQNVYQRRADLIPNLVETIKGYASHERGTLTDVIEARAKATKISIDPSKVTADDLAKFQKVQGEFSTALSRLMVVVERYPDLKANQNFRELQNELSRTENRITVERQEFNKSAQSYNVATKRFPASLLAGIFAFKAKPYFQAEEGAQKTPKVNFGK